MTNFSQSADVYKDQARVPSVGLIVYDDQKVTLPCVVKERTADGARIQVESPYNLPMSFVLFVESVGFTAECKIAWRDPNEVGVQFLTTSVNEAASTNKSKTRVAEPPVFAVRTAKKGAPAKENQPIQPAPFQAQQTVPRMSQPVLAARKPAQNPVAPARNVTTSNQEEAATAGEKRPQTRPVPTKEGQAVSLARQAPTKGLQGISLVKEASSKSRQSAPLVRQSMSGAKPAVPQAKSKPKTPLDQQLALDADLKTPPTAVQLAAAQARQAALQKPAPQARPFTAQPRQPAPQSNLIVPRPKNLKSSGPILIADDDPDDRLMMHDAFKQCEDLPEIEFVRDGQELLDYLNGDEEHFGKPWPSLILLDLNMPRMDGRVALVKIKSHETWRSIPVIILTTSNAELDIERTYSLGASSFIQKPSTFAELVDMTQTLVKFRSTYAIIG